MRPYIPDSAVHMLIVCMQMCLIVQMQTNVKVNQEERSFTALKSAANVSRGCHVHTECRDGRMQKTVNGNEIIQSEEREER